MTQWLGGLDKNMANCDIGGGRSKNTVLRVAYFLNHPLFSISYFIVPLLVHFIIVHLFIHFLFLWNLIYIPPYYYYYHVKFSLFRV